MSQIALTKKEEGQLAHKITETAYTASIKSRVVFNGPGLSLKGFESELRIVSENNASLGRNSCVCDALYRMAPYHLELHVMRWGKHDKIVEQKGVA